MPDFKALALPLIQRGWRVTPVSADGKRGVARNWGRWQFRTPEDLNSNTFATCNAGVVSFRGVGNLCFFDDDSGVVARMEKEGGKKFPTTYQVRTRPGSDHTHYYFTQTEYSFRKFGWFNSTNINVRDISRLVDSPSGGKMHPTIFDLKGVGGAALVVAAGSSRLNGDMYTCVNDVEPVPIPDWLVDWVIAADKAQEKALWKDRAKKWSVKKNGADDFLIYEEDRTDFVKAYAVRLVLVGLDGPALDVALAAVVVRFVENGESFVSTDRGRNSIARHARAAEKWKGWRGKHQTQNVHFPPVSKFYAPDGDFTEGLKIGRRPLTDADILRAVISNFDDVISNEAAKAAMEKALPTFGRNHRNTVSRLREELGFEVGARHWTRVRSTSSSLLSTYIGMVTGHVPTSHETHRDTFPEPFANHGDGMINTDTNKPKKEGQKGSKLGGSY